MAPKLDIYVFVLWGNNFDETVATILITQLREFGLWVKMIGVSSQGSKGSYGLTLVPDLTVDQVLPMANKAACVIIPYASRGIKKLKNDPRLTRFFSQAYTNNALFVIGRLENDVAELDLFPVSSNNVLVYPDYEALFAFARHLKDSLA